MYGKDDDHNDDEDNDILAEGIDEKKRVSNKQIKQDEEIYMDVITRV